MTPALTVNYGTRARLGVLFPSGNTAVEPQFEAMRPRGVSCHFGRLALTGSSERQLLGMSEGVEGAAQLLKDAGVKLIAFHCTAVSTWDSALEASILRRIEESTGLPAVATSQALVAALHALDARRLAMLSPYNQAIALREQSFLERAGFDVVANDYLGVDTPDEMIAVEPSTWLEMAAGLSDRGADVTLVSCTAIRALEIVEAAEQATGKPLITSNSAMFWHAMRALGIDDDLPGIGALGRCAR